MCVVCVCICERGRKKERWRKGEREGGGKEGERGMRGVCACVRVYVCTCVEGGRKGRGKEGERKRCDRCVYVCIYVPVHMRACVWCV